MEICIFEKLKKRIFVVSVLVVLATYFAASGGKPNLLKTDLPKTKQQMVGSDDDKDSQVFP